MTNTRFIGTKICLDHVYGLIQHMWEWATIYESQGNTDIKCQSLVEAGISQQNGIKMPPRDMYIIL